MQISFTGNGAQHKEKFICLSSVHRLFPYKAEGKKEKRKKER